MRPFTPAIAGTKNVAVAATTTTPLLLGNPTQVRVMNNGTATAWFEFGGSGVTASASSSIPVAPGATEVFTVPDSLNGAPVYVATIAAAATGNVYFTPGAGI